MSDEVIYRIIRVIEELIAVKRKSEKKNRIWVKNWILRRRSLGASNCLLRELSKEDTKSYNNFLRMDEDMFDFLLNKVSCKIQKRNTVMREALPAKIKLEVALRYLATGDSLQSMEYLYRVSKSAISMFLPEVFDAIYEGLKEYIQVPKTVQEWNEIISGFDSTWNFPAFGAIDGKHIIIDCPAHSGSNYFNYKGTFSIVLLALVDHNYNFTCIDVGSYGSNSDAGIFAKSSLRKAIEENKLNIPEGAVMLGDEAFPLKMYLMKPYARRKQLSKREKIYNYRHCRARRIVENGFGIMASRFRIFRKPIPLLPESVIKLVKASCALHNWLRKKCGKSNSISVDIEDHETGRILPGSWRNEPRPCGLVNIATSTQRNYLIEARQKRDRFADHFMGEGAVSWQSRMID